jgi:hypothetical protein
MQGKAEGYNLSNPTPTTQKKKKTALFYPKYEQVYYKPFKIHTAALFSPFL